MKPTEISLELMKLQELERLADQGDANAQCKLGHMYKNGQDVERDYFISFAWYKKSAEQGHADAQYNLGLMYAHGQGVEEDIVLALDWSVKATDEDMVRPD